ncbi:carbon storage regulator [Alienimonas californiensis]|uniref:Translational regulator CsrA n=1 Tax=Alienimonas californiensis TaxID=2527989 RepID=A0A517P710_9PLAN|nr:carbon storage regulator [Alienimonas californiensis]QDT15161.1 Carbon storage regulator [Alienimonas californiensis]
MLILSRKLGQSIRLPEQNVTVHVVAVTGRTVRLGVEAPPEVTILRSELDRSELDAAPAAPPPPPTVAPPRDLPPSRDLEELCSALDRLADRLSAAERDLAARDAGPGSLADLTEELEQTRRTLARIAGCGGATSLAC